MAICDLGLGVSFPNRNPAFMHILVIKDALECLYFSIFILSSQIALNKETLTEKFRL